MNDTLSALKDAESTLLAQSIRIANLEKLAKHLANALRAHDRWHMEFGAEGYCEYGGFVSQLCQQTEMALIEFTAAFPSLNQEPTNEEEIKEGEK